METADIDVANWSKTLSEHPVSGTSYLMIKKKVWPVLFLLQ